MNNKLFVGNLSFNTTENDLQDMFAAHGTVTEANLMMDRATGRPRGFGFVTMSTEEEAQKAVEYCQTARRAFRPGWRRRPSPVQWRSAQSLLTSDPIASRPGEIRASSFSGISGRSMNVSLRCRQIVANSCELTLSISPLVIPQMQITIAAPCKIWFSSF
jgi:RNA recognition motif-containing protein